MVFILYLFEILFHL